MPSLTRPDGAELHYTIDSVKAWQQRISQSRLVILEGDAWHAAGAYPDRCAQEAVKFIAAVL